MELNLAAWLIDRAIRKIEFLGHKANSGDSGEKVLENDVALAFTVDRSALVSEISRSLEMERLNPLYRETENELNKIIQGPPNIEDNTRRVVRIRNDVASSLRSVISTIQQPGEEVGFKTVMDVDSVERAQLTSMRQTESLLREQITKYEQLLSIRSAECRQLGLKLDAARWEIENHHKMISSWENSAWDVDRSQIETAAIANECLRQNVQANHARLQKLERMHSEYVRREKSENERHLKWAAESREETDKLEEAVRNSELILECMLSRC